MKNWKLRSKDCLAINSALLSGEGFFLLEQIRAVEGVALGGDVSGILDDAAELVFVGVVAHSGGEDNVFFNQDAADVVSAELQAHLTDLDPGCQPARLDV